MRARRHRQADQRLVPRPLERPPAKPPLGLAAVVLGGRLEGVPARQREPCVLLLARGLPAQGQSARLPPAGSVTPMTGRAAQSHD